MDCAFTTTNTTNSEIIIFHIKANIINNSSIFSSFVGIKNYKTNKYFPLLVHDEAISHMEKIIKVYFSQLLMKKEQ